MTLWQHFALLWHFSFQNLKIIDRLTRGNFQEYTVSTLNRQEYILIHIILISTSNMVPVTAGALQTMKKVTVQVSVLTINVFDKDKHMLLAWEHILINIYQFKLIRK